jgi:hypothetical protein
MSNPLIEDSFLRYVKKLNELNDIEISLDGNIEDIMDNPEEWAEQQVEKLISDNLGVLLEAKEMGKEFADALQDER